MPEMMFVIKSFVIATLVMMALQVKIGGSSLESRAEHWIQTSAVSGHLQEVSAGAVLAIQNAFGLTQDFVTKTFNTETTQKSSRFNLDFKRSAKAEKEQNSDDN